MARCRAVALETIQDNLSSPLALVQLLIAVSSSRSPDEMGAPVQVAAFRQEDEAEPSRPGCDVSEPAAAFTTGARLQKDTLLLLLLLCCCFVVFGPVHGHELTGFQKHMKCQSDRSFATLAAEGEQLVKARERWKFNLLTIRTPPS